MKRLIILPDHVYQAITVNQHLRVDGSNPVQNTERTAIERDHGNGLPGSVWLYRPN